MMIPFDELVDLNRRGLIPGPGESAYQFRQRVDSCLNECHSYDSKEVSILEEAANITESLYDIRCDWIPLIFSNETLAPWHGGCAWIIEPDDQGSLGATLQLRKSFYDSSCYLGIYRRQELIAHELAHVGRMAYEEPMFEELLAYRSSFGRFRRYFGPIIQSTKEVILFLVVLTSLLFLDIVTTIFDGPPDYFAVAWLKLIPLGLVAYGVGRLWMRQYNFRRCFANLKGVVHGDNTANAIIYRLTDKEILHFAKLSPEKIKAYAEARSEESLRWRLIYGLYFR